MVQQTQEFIVQLRDDGDWEEGFKFEVNTSSMHLVDYGESDEDLDQDALVQIFENDTVVLMERLREVCRTWTAEVEAKYQQKN